MMTIITIISSNRSRTATVTPTAIATFGCSTSSYTTVDDKFSVTPAVCDVIVETEAAVLVVVVIVDVGDGDDDEVLVVEADDSVRKVVKQVTVSVRIPLVYHNTLQATLC